MKPLHFAPPQFEPTARLLKAEASRAGIKMDILKRDDGCVACHFHGSYEEANEIACRVLAKHGDALR